MPGYQTSATQLTADLQAWMEDDGTEFAGSIPEVINLGELRLARDLDLSIFRATETTPTVQGVSAVVKPAGYAANQLGAQSISFESGASSARTFLELRSYEWIEDYLTTAEGAPQYYAEPDETNFIVAPLPDTVYTLTVRYIIRPAALVVTTNETNWLSDNVGDLLFKACLAEAEKFLKSDDRIPIWEQDYASLIPASKRELYDLMAARYPEIRAFPLGAGQ